ncbi:MAG: ribosome-associated translation inhibitor RaiA [PVC group bacterium]|nr:ribosome-associated translation inhibitor RaiA [PVC group bacterium]
MQVTITGRHFSVTQSLKEYIHKKVDRFNKYSSNIIETHVVLGVEKYRNFAEISVFGKQLKITEKKENETMYAAIDDVCTGLEKALSRHKDKIKGHRKKDSDKYKVDVDEEGGYTDEDNGLFE